MGGNVFPENTMHTQLLKQLKLAKHKTQTTQNTTQQAHVHNQRPGRWPTSRTLDVYVNLLWCVAGRLGFVFGEFELLE